MNRGKVFQIRFKISEFLRIADVAKSLQARHVSLWISIIIPPARVSIPASSISPPNFPRQTTATSSIIFTRPKQRTEGTKHERDSQLDQSGPAHRVETCRGASLLLLRVFHPGALGRGCFRGASARESVMPATSYV